MATFNWLITCRCGNPIEYYCNTCGEKLCPNCKETHLQSNETKHHEIIEYVNKLMPGHLSSPLCHDHGGKECIYWCQTCKKAVCMDCVPSLHNGHRFNKLETVLQENRTNLQKELKNLESKVIKEWQDLMAEARKTTIVFLHQVNGVEKELENTAKKFHKKVDEILENNNRQLKEWATSRIAILLEQEKRVSDGLENVKNKIKECEDKLRDGDVESLLAYDGSQDEDILPIISSAVPPVFTPSQIDSKSFTEMFGKLTVPSATQAAKGNNQSSTDVSQDTEMSFVRGSVNEPVASETVLATASIDNKSISAPGGDTQAPSSDNAGMTKHLLQLIPHSSVHSEFSPGYPFPSLVCEGSGQAWVKTADKKLQLMDRHGSVNDALQVNFEFEDMVRSPQGDILLSDSHNNYIKSISCDKTVHTLFRIPRGSWHPRFEWQPYGICHLHSGNIAITLYNASHVMIFGMSGGSIKELDKKLFTYPYRVAQNKVNNDIYIIDKTNTRFDSTGSVLAFGIDYKIKYQYTGSNGESFYPSDLCTDMAGHVLITDTDNHQVHILDKDGLFLHYLLTKEQGLGWPYSIDVDTEGNAWVGEWNGNVKVVKYLK